MANKKHAVITMRRLQSALGDVCHELDTFGFWNDRLAEIDVYLTWIGSAFGYQLHNSTGHIEIPAVSLSRLGECIFGGPRCTLRDVLRHEYGHAVADTNRGLIRSKRFRDVFRTAYDSCIESDFSSSQHVSEYASKDSSEDFAEVFMYFLKHRGRLPRRFTTPAIKKKWTFVDQLRKQISKGERKW